MLQVNMFGAPRVFWNDVPIRICRLQTRALLYRLASVESINCRDQLCHYFWPNQSEVKAKARLAHLICDLRKNLPDPSLVQLDQQNIWLDPKAVQTDLQRFEQCHRSTLPVQEDLLKAINLYHGEFLEGFTLPSSAEYELWLVRNKELWANRFRAVLTQLIELQIDAGKHWAAIDSLLHFLRFDDLNEDVHRRLMEQYLAIGNRQAAIRQFEQCADLLYREIGAAPSNTTRRVYQVALTPGLN